jgi:hypothetical protein
MDPTKYRPFPYYLKVYTEPTSETQHILLIQTVHSAERKYSHDSTKQVSHVFRIRFSLTVMLMIMTGRAIYSLTWNPDHSEGMVFYISISISIKLRLGERQRIKKSYGKT